MIIAVDYDGTLENNGVMNHALIRKLKASQKAGNAVILWTCRNGARLNEAVSNLRKAGFAPNRVNDNMPEIIARLGNTRKVYADIYIDDKAVK